MSSSTTPSHNYILFNNVFLHILILFSLLTTLYLFYIRKLTVDGFNGEFIHIIEEMFKELKKDTTTSPLLKEKFNDTVQQFLGDNITLEDFAKLVKDSPDKLLEANNRRLTEELFFVIGALILAVIIINVLPPTMFSSSNGLKLLLIELLIVFSMVAFIEYWFFTNVATKFIPVKPSFLNTYLKEKLTKMLNK